MKSRLFAMGAVLAIACLTGAVPPKPFMEALRTSDGESLAEQDGWSPVRGSRGAI